jgi:hypothetical protein
MVLVAKLADLTGPLNGHTSACLQSVLARGLHALLPPIEVVKGSYCNANPDNPREWEVQRLARSPPGIH